MALSSFKEGILRGHVALVTGGGSGICMGIAQRFLEAGCDVAILSRDAKKLMAAAKGLEKSAAGSRCYPISADVRKYEEIEFAVDQVLKEFGRIDILVNGAAGNFLCAPETLSYNAFKAVMEIDAHGTFIVSKVVHNKAFVKQAPLKDNSAIRGIIINISMTLHYTGTLLQTHAGAAKAAIDSMTQHLAVEWGPQGVRVVGIAPGPIEGTVGLAKLSASHDDKSKRSSTFSDIVPLQRLGTLNDVASACLFMCLPEASYITGHTMVVDGGQWLASGNFPLFDEQIRKEWLNKGNNLPRENGMKSNL